MLARRKVRTKLLAIAAPGVICAGVLGALTAEGRLDDADAARRTLAVSTALSRADAFVHQLQIERSLQVRELVVTPATPSPELAAQAVSTDAAARALDWSLEALLRVPTGTQPAGEATPVEIVQSIGRSTTRVDDVREQSGAGVTPRTRLDSYTSLVMPVVASSRSLALLDADVDRDVVALHWLTEATEAQSYLAAGTIANLGVDTADTQFRAETTPALVDAFHTDLDGFVGDASTTSATQVRKIHQDQRFTGSSLDGSSTTSTLSEAAGTPESTAGVAEALHDAAIERTGVLHDVSVSVLTTQQRHAERVVASSKDAVRNVLVALATALVLVVGLALVVGRRIDKGLRSLSRTAKQITDRQLPAMVDALRGQGGEIEVPRPTSGRRDEFVDVADALDALGRMATVVTAQQTSAVRKGISDIFVNLARRNQGLLDRQIEFIDRLETNEEDPDQLDNLFKLDHLATRMRRNAESLLVLAGAEAPRQRDRRVPMTDVIRVAIGEVEDFDRIVMPRIDEVVTDGAAAVDLAHLLSEIMENGTHFSPPDQLVEVVGYLDDDGRYSVTVTDQGIGMSTSKLAELTTLLADPPQLGLAMSRSLGFVVVATLAARHGIEVEVAAAPRPRAGRPGTRVTVHVPAALVEKAAPVAPVASSVAPYLRPPVLADTVEMPVVVETAEPAAETVEQPPVVVSVDEPVVTVDASWWFPDQVPAAPEPTNLDDRLPEGAAFDTGLYSLLDRTPPTAADEAAAADEESLDELPHRRPGASIEPVSAGGAIAPPSRRPEAIRAVLTRFRGGLAAGRREAGSTDGDGTDVDEVADVEPTDGGDAP